MIATSDMYITLNYSFRDDLKGFIVVVLNNLLLEIVSSGLYYNHYINAFLILNT